MQNQMNVQNTNNQQPIQDKVSKELLNQDIFKSLKLENLPEEQKEKLKQKMVDTIQGRIMARIMDQLSQDDQKKFKELLDAGDNEATGAFLNEKVKMQDIVIQEILLYKAEMIDNAQKIDEMVKSQPAK